MIHGQRYFGRVPIVFFDTFDTFIFDTFTFFSDKIGDIFFVTWSMQTGF